MKDTGKFIRIEAYGANLLLGATIIALVVSNSPLGSYYETLFKDSLSVQWGSFQLTTNLKFLINDVLMCIFFLVVGLEIKYELLLGSLNSVHKAILPVVAALGGMILPAAIYVAFNYHSPVNLRGWAIPTATDIAFALGVLSLLRARVIPALKAFLTTLAIIDDLAAILIIAFFYTEHLSFPFLWGAALCLSSLLLLNWKKVNILTPYFFIGILLWSCLFFGGVHPTLAGVLLAFTIPLYNEEYNLKYRSPLRKVINLLHPVVTLVILPLFAFANAGIALFKLSIDDLHLSILFGVFVGLFVGKQVGIFTSCWLAVKLGIAKLPQHVNWIDLYAIAILCGIGFTISLFISSLAFSELHVSRLNSVKLGVLSGSFLSGITGYLVLFFTSKKRRGTVKH